MAEPKKQDPKLLALVSNLDLQPGDCLLRSVRFQKPVHFRSKNRNVIAEHVDQADLEDVAVVMRGGFVVLDHQGDHDDTEVPLTNVACFVRMPLLEVECAHCHKPHVPRAVPGDAGSYCDGCMSGVSTSAPVGDLCDRCGKPFGDTGPSKVSTPGASKYCQACTDRDVLRPAYIDTIEAGLSAPSSLLKAIAPADALQAAQAGLATGDLTVPEAKALLDAAAPPAPTEAAQPQQAVPTEQPRLTKAQRKAARKAGK